MKKITSILLAIQMIMGIFIAESYAADTGEIRIEAENYTETTAEMDIKEVKGDFSADKCLQKYYAKPTEDTYIISYSFNVPKIGRYELKGVGNVRQQANTTDWNVYINNEDNTPAEYAKLSDVTSKTYPSVL